jgi:FAD:protein FMN transferase
VIRRARPLLGTLVAITADVPASGMQAAFTAIQCIHDLMSAQSSCSEIARINREACRAPVPVHPWTLRVLQTAVRISEQSDGAFDVVSPASRARFSDLVLERGSVRLRRPARIDVSGIAKGFAVDSAVELLQARGASAGSVNAGGDLRFFGDWRERVRVRIPGQPRLAVCLPPSRHQAFATSSGYFGGRIHDPRSGARLHLDWSVTIAAATCMVADALTKAVALLGPSKPLLAAFGATAFAVQPDGRLYATTAQST